MENNLINKPIHIEFYGLPGSGKSTISHIIAEELRKENNFIVEEPTYNILYSNSKVKRILSKILYSLFLLFINPISFLKLMKLIKDNGYKGKEIYKQFANIAYKIVIYKFQKQNHIYIWDEGLIQSALSLSMFNNIKANTNYNNLFLILNKKVIIKKIFLNVDKETVKQRLELRENKHSRVEKMNGEEVNLTLDRIENCVKQINDLYTYEISTLDDLAALKEYIINTINVNKIGGKNENSTCN